LGVKGVTLSKGKATSDRVEGKRRNIVKRQANFGQCWWKKQKHCPKARQLWTVLNEKPVRLSKGKPTSASVGRESRNTVTSL
jgi:hypothetical protein